MNKASKTKQISIKRSITRSVTIVPKAFSNGIFSYVLKVVALKISPDRGTPKFAKYEIITAELKFTYFGLYPIGASKNFQRYALER